MLTRATSDSCSRLMASSQAAAKFANAIDHGTRAFNWGSSDRSLRVGQVDLFAPSSASCRKDSWPRPGETRGHARGWEAGERGDQQTGGHASRSKCVRKLVRPSHTPDSADATLSRTTDTQHERKALPMMMDDSAKLRPRPPTRRSKQRTARPIVRPMQEQRNRRRSSGPRVAGGAGQRRC